MTQAKVTPALLEALEEASSLLKEEGEDMIKWARVKVGIESEDDQSERRYLYQEGARMVKRAKLIRKTFNIS